MKTLDTGVYSITNTSNGKVYIGSSLRVGRRLAAHRQSLLRKDHHSAGLQRAFLKYGEASFKFQKLLVCAPENRVMYEQILMDAHKSNNAKFGYNMSKYAHAPAPAEITDEYRENLSNSLRAVAKKYEFNGQMMCLYGISEATGIPKKTLLSRVIDRGMSIDDAVSMPLRVFVKKYEFNGIAKTPKEWSDHTGINLNVLLTRLRKGWDIDKALTKPIQCQDQVMLTHNGITLNTSQWAKKVGISQALLQKRIGDLGWSVDRALTEKTSGTNTIIFNGESKRLSEWAKAIGCKPHTLLARLDRGWSLDKALTTPPRATGMEKK